MSRRGAKLAVDYAAYVAVRTFICIVQTLSLEACQTASRLLAWLAWHVLRIRRKVVLDNLAIAFPEADQRTRHAIALAMWEHLLLMVAEIAHAPRKIHRTNWRKHSHLESLPALVRHLISPRPTVLISGHFGNFEMGGYLLGLHGFATHTIARPLDNPFLDRWVTRFRGATGQHMLPKRGSSDQIERLLASGGTLALLGDQYAGDRACWVDFFGKPASTHKAVALFTLSGSAPTAVCAVLRLGRPLEFRMQLAGLIDPNDPACPHRSVVEITRWFTAALEEQIRHAPGQYWWLHRRWKGDPEAARARRRARRQGAA